MYGRNFLRYLYAENSEARLVYPIFQHIEDLLCLKMAVSLEDET